jgi:predicted Zn-dependent peptidase
VLQHTLPTGLRVVLQPDPAATAVAVSVAYRAGSSYESDGQHGFSYALLEHLRAAQPASSTMAHASPDLLQLTTVVAPSRLPVALWREAHRLARRIQEGSIPALRAHLDLPASPSARAQRLTYQGCPPYGHAAHGWTADLQRASVASLEAFRQQHVQPAHAVLTVAGPIDPDAVLEQVKHLFAPLPSLPPTAPPEIVLPDQINQRVDLERHDAPPSQMFLYGWAVAPVGHADLAAIHLLVETIADRAGTAGTLRSPRFAKLPPEATIHVVLEERTGPSWLTLQVDFPSTLDMDHTRKVIDDALLDLANHGPTSDEMHLAWRSAQVRLLRDLARVDSRASLLARTALLQGDPVALFRRPADLVAINREDLQRAARQYLTPIRRNLIEVRGPRVEPPKPETPEPPPARTTKPSTRKSSVTRPNSKKPSAPRRSAKPKR